MEMISNRSKSVPFSPFRKLLPLADEAKANGVKIFHLNIGQPDIPTPQAAMEALSDYPTTMVPYTPGYGTIELREKWASYINRFTTGITSADITITTGGSEALQLLMFSCFDAGDEIIVPEPFYANYNGFAEIAGLKVKPLTTTIEKQFELPALDVFTEAISDKTRGIIITNPNNPTGRTYPAEVLEGLLKLCKQHNLLLISDEVYREFIYGNEPFKTVLDFADYEAHAIAVDSISKRYSSCGARIGAVVCRNEKLQEALRRYTNLRLSPPALGQFLAERIIDSESEKAYLDSVIEEYDRRRKVVYSALQEMPEVISYEPDGAFYCFARFPIHDSEHFCKWLLTDFRKDGKTVMLSPGTGFYASEGKGKQEVRIAYILNEDDLKEAMDCLGEALRVYPGRTVLSASGQVG